MGNLAVCGFLRTGYWGQHTFSLSIVCLCEWGSGAGMWEPERGIYPTPSITISYIPHQFRHIRWPCPPFWLILFHLSAGVTLIPQTPHAFKPSVWMDTLTEELWDVSIKMYEQRGVRQRKSKTRQWTISQESVGLGLQQSGFICTCSFRNNKLRTWKCQQF